VAKKRKRPAIFSATKAVKANARARLGTPPPGAPIPDRRSKAQHKPTKHKKKLEDLITAAERET
jgi:hypothetical protein